MNNRRMYDRRKALTRAKATQAAREMRLSFYGLAVSMALVLTYAMR